MEGKIGSRGGEEGRWEGEREVEVEELLTRNQMEGGLQVADRVRAGAKRHLVDGSTV